MTHKNLLIINLYQLLLYFINIEGVLLEPYTTKQYLSVQNNTVLSVSGPSLKKSTL